MDILLFAFLIIFKVNAENWAYLLAGSKNYYNYRHQADIAHASTFLRKQGFDGDKIIYLSYDDIPRSEENHYYNFLRNHPDGSNVYTNNRIDYTGSDVNAKIVYASMSGDLETIRNNGTGRFLNVTKDDTVFIYFSDHGAPGIFCLPGGVLESRDLVKALRALKERCKYVLVFVEACNSGSLFANKITRKDKGILTVTASNSHESSYAYYYDSELGTYLGDEFSVKFLEYLDQVDTSKETLRNLIHTVKNRTALSHVSAFGDVKMFKLPLSTFFKASTKKEKSQERRISGKLSPDDYAPSHEVDKKIAEKLLEKDPFHLQAQYVLKRHYTIKDFFEGVRNEYLLKKGVEAEIKFVDAHTEEINSCYRATREFYFNNFKESREASLSYYYLKYLLSLCSQNIKAEEINSTMKRLIRDMNVSA